LIEGHVLVDYVVIGEYEISLLRLIECLRDGGSVASLRGIAYRDERGKAVINERSEAIAPLDDLPILARHLFPAYFETDMAVYRDAQREIAFLSNEESGEDQCWLATLHLNCFGMAAAAAGGNGSRCFPSSTVHRYIILSNGGAGCSPRPCPRSP
jgi:hypothetical protein